MGKDNRPGLSDDLALDLTGTTRDEDNFKTEMDQRDKQIAYAEKLYDDKWKDKDPKQPKPGYVGLKLRHAEEFMAETVDTVATFANSHIVGKPEAQIIGGTLHVGQAKAPLTQVQACFDGAVQEAAKNKLDTDRIAGGKAIGDASGDFTQGNTACHVETNGDYGHASMKISDADGRVTDIYTESDVTRFHAKAPEETFMSKGVIHAVSDAIWKAEGQVEAVTFAKRHEIENKAKQAAAAPPVSRKPNLSVKPF